MDNDPNQIIWFVKELIKSNDADWVIVVCHHPIYSAGKNGIRNRTLWLRRVVQPYLEKYKVALFFNGHDHSLQHTYKEGDHCDYVTSGGGHDFDDKVEIAIHELNKQGVTVKYVGRGHGFVGMKIRGDQVTVSYIREDGTVEYEFQKRNPRA